MKRQVVQDFLNLPGIVGVALMDGRSRPYFCGVEQILNFQQREAIAQGIQQVVETTPVDLQSFSFQFVGCQVHIYKLRQGLILMVLARENLIAHTYYPAISKLKASLQDDLNNAVATFQLLAGAANLAPTENQVSDAAADTVLTELEPTLEPAQAAANSSSYLSAPVSDPGIAASALPTLAETLAALNHLSEFSARYLGKIVVANALKSARPKDSNWLQQFEINRKGAIVLKLDRKSDSQLSPEQHAWVQLWAAAFAEKCTKIIRNYPELLKNGIGSNFYRLLFEA